MEEEYSEIDFQSFKIRLKLCIPRIKILLRRNLFSELLEKLCHWCHISASPDQIEKFKASLGETSSENEVESQPQMTVSQIARSIYSWFTSEKPEMGRIKPQTDLNVHRYMLILYTLIKDYKYLQRVLTQLNKKNSAIKKKLYAYTKKHKKLWTFAKSSHQLSLDHVELTIDEIKENIQLAISHVEIVKSLDRNHEYTDNLQLIIDFYEKQNTLVKDRSKELDNKHNDFVMCLFQKKLLKYLKTGKNITKINTYREKLIKLYLENIPNSEEKLVNLSEIEILKKLKTKSKENSTDLKLSLVKLWTNLSPSLKEICEKINRENGRLAINSEQFDHILEFVISRMNTGTSDARGSDFIKYHHLARKYVSFKEKRLNVYNNPPMVYDFFTNIIQNIIWDYQNLAKSEILTSRYTMLLALIQGSSIDFHSFHDLFFSVRLAICLGSHIDIELEDLNLLIEQETESEMKYLTEILVTSIDLSSYTPEILKQMLIENLNDLPDQSIIQKHAEALGIDMSSSEDSSKGSPAKIAKESSRDLLENPRTENPFLDLSVITNINPEIASPKQDVITNTDSLKALGAIFKFYSNQKSESLEAKPFSYMNLEQFKIFCKDFQICQDCPDKIQYVFGSKTFVSEIQFISAVELLSSFYIDLNLSPKEKFNRLLQEIGCFDSSYNAKMQGTSEISHSHRLSAVPSLITSPSSNKEFRTSRWTNIKHRTSNHSLNLPKVKTTLSPTQRFKSYTNINRSNFR